MNNRRYISEEEFEQLVRCAVELEQLDADAAGESSRSTDRRVLSLTGDSRLRRWIDLAVPLTAAALVIWSFLPNWHPSRGVDHPVQHAPLVKADTMDLSYWPGEADDDGARVDCFQAHAAENCSVVAVFHRWYEDCQCLDWQLYSWEDGRPLADLSAQDVEDITLEVTDAPPVEQLLVIAIARNPADLPRDETEALALIACLEEVAPDADENEAASQYASAVRSCLPPSVTVVPRSFVVE